MSNSLYDISVGSYLQSLSGLARVLEKGATFAAENDLDANDFVGVRLHEDMLPFLYQVNSSHTHSMQAVESLKSGVFTPPMTPNPLDYAGLQGLVNNTISDLEAVSANEVNAAQGKPVLFKMGDMEMPFTAENFVLSFSLPNLYFHVTTAYDILRMKGVPVGKGDFLGKMRLGN